MRTLEEIKKEYADGCVKTGHIQYQIFTLSKDLEVLNSSLRDLNFEAAKLQAEAAKTAAETTKEVK